MRAEKPIKAPEHKVSNPEENKAVQMQEETKVDKKQDAA